MSRGSTPPRKLSPTAWRTVPLPADWARVVRPRILARDPYCTLRTRCWGSRSTEVDHIGDPNDHRDENLRGVCTTCHGRRTGQQGNAAMNAQRPNKKRAPLRHPSMGISTNGYGQ